MAGVTVTITVDDSAVRDVLARLDAFIASPPADMWQDIGEAMLNSWRDRAKEEIDPDGIPWRPLSDEYKAYKERKRPGVPILKFDVHMLGDMMSYQAGDGFVDIGTNAVYGAIHQFGGTPDMAPGPAAIPARPFLGLSADDVTAVEEIVAEYLDEIAGEA